ncbi:MAG: PadR family transcriptional regulator [Candidatus Omnitrophota bacterium]|jgi:DNA-binding PadR family transcriptional regulator
MIEQELLFLGLLNEGAKHGYEIKKRIKEMLSLFAGLEIKSIYYPLKVLEKNGLVIKRTVRQPRRPNRLIYSLTDKGKIRFNNLLLKSFLDFRRPQFSLDISLYFLRYVKPKMLKRRIQARIRLLKRISSGLNRMVRSLKSKRSPSFLWLILEHNLEMVNTEVHFLERLLKHS